MSSAAVNRPTHDHAASLLFLSSARAATAPASLVALDTHDGANVSGQVASHTNTFTHIIICVQLNVCRSPGGLCAEGVLWNTHTLCVGGTLLLKVTSCTFCYLCYCRQCTRNYLQHSTFNHHCLRKIVHGVC